MRCAATAGHGKDSAYNTGQKKKMSQRSLDGGNKDINLNL
jgi:hypothetical protein